MSLGDILAARDARAERERELLALRPDASLLVLTVVMPGRVKRDRRSLACAREALHALRASLGDRILCCEERDLPTGFEAFLSVDLPAEELKRAAVEIEDTHPLGRLFDLDVIASDGTPRSRTGLGFPARKCLICGNDARICMRTRAHDYDEILARIDILTRPYVAED